MFTDFRRRLQRDVKKQCDARLKASEKLNYCRIKPTPINVVKMVSHHVSGVNGRVQIVYYRQRRMEMEVSGTTSSV